MDEIILYTCSLVIITKQIMKKKWDRESAAVDIKFSE